jgi:hypothetical protein
MRLELSQLIDRPLREVFQFAAIDHVRNHPRWDPMMELEQLTGGPIGVGTLIRRRSTHGRVPVDGTMEVVEFVPDHALGMVIHDGPIEMRSRMIFEPDGPQRTRIIGHLDIPSMAEPMDPAPIQNSLRRMKELIETSRED